jgi:hypothetical protein
MGFGNVEKAIWQNLSVTTSPDVVALYANLYQKLEGSKSGVGTTGSIFFVDPIGGADTNSGLTPALAFATTPYALTQCVARRGDIIVRMPGNEYSDEAGAGLGAAIAMNVRGVTLIGLNAFNPDQTESNCSYGRYDSTLGWGGGGALGPVFEITEPCNIIGLTVVCDSAWAPGANGGGAAPDTMPLGVAIAMNGWQGGFQGSYNYIGKCRFPNWGGAEGINLFGSAYNLIEDCMFEDLSVCGVHIDAGFQNSNYNRIKRCHFRGMVNGIQMTAGIRRPYIEECMFEGQTGYGITGTATVTAATPGFAFGNWFALEAPAAAGGHPAVGDAYDALIGVRRMLCAGNHYTTGVAGTNASDPTA